MNTKNTVERAFELARGGQCRSLDDVRRQLTAEKHENVASHLSGKSLGKQLRALMATSPVEQAEG